MVYGGMREEQGGLMAYIRFIKQHNIIITIYYTIFRCKHIRETDAFVPPISDIVPRDTVEGMDVANEGEIDREYLLIILLIR